MNTVIIKSGDTAIEFRDTLTVDGVPYNLTDCTVKFLMAFGSRTFSAAATVVSPAAGTVKYPVGTGFPTEPGAYQQEWEVTTAANRVLSFPGDTFNIVSIIDDLN